MRKLAALAISLYQALARPLLPRACRFEPSCSDYARDAVLSRGLLAGLSLSAQRLLRCHPFVAGGFDPVPHG